MKKILLTVLLSCLINITGFSQSLSVDTVSTEASVPDTVNYNDNLTHTVTIFIGGGTPYTGAVYLMTGVDSTGGLLSVDTVSIRNVVNKFNDTIMFPVNEIYNNSNGYRFGGNVVVIWPFAPTLNTVDTFNTNVFVLESVGINEDPALYSAFSIYPNPTKDYISIQKSNNNLQVKQVRIYDANGRLVYDEEFKSKIDISKLQKGIYFLNMSLKQGDVLHYKLIKE
jgi:Secretion system C-terminal sorting domain